MDAFYQRLETSLLGFGLVLGLAVTVLVAVTGRPVTAETSVTLPMIEVWAER